jgi:hypothetical protein
VGRRYATASKPARDYQDAAAHEDLVDALARDALALAEKPG